MGLKIPYNYITYNGKSSADYGVWVSGGGTFDAPSRDVQTVSVPGRNGDLTFDNGRFTNIPVTYPAFISNRFQPRIDDFRAWLCSHVGYQRLEDTYHPDEFRIGVYKSGLSVSPTARNLAGSFALTFDCKPQRYLKSGEQPMTFSASGVVRNPTNYAALPLIRCNGQSGTVTVNGKKVTITGCTNHVMLDCDMMEAYEGTANRNGTTTLNNGVFPTLAPGNNAVSFTGFTSVVITPRFFTI